MLDNILNNDLTKKLLVKSLRKSLSENGSHGIYLFINDADEVEIRNYTNDPKQTIIKLTKQLIENEK
jgi:hypothetical protein